MFVPADRFASLAVHVGKPVQSGTGQDAVDGRCDAESGGELHGPSRSRIRRLTHRFVVALSVLFGEVFGRDE